MQRKVFHLCFWQEIVFLWNNQKYYYLFLLIKLNTLSLDPELELESLNKEENLQNNVDIEEERETLLGSLHENHLSSNFNLNSSFSTI